MNSRHPLFDHSGRPAASGAVTAEKITSIYPGYRAQPSSAVRPAPTGPTLTAAEQSLFDRAFRSPEASAVPAHSGETSAALAKAGWGGR